MNLKARLIFECPNQSQWVSDLSSMHLDDRGKLRAEFNPPVGVYRNPYTTIYDEEGNIKCMAKVFTLPTEKIIQINPGESFGISLDMSALENFKIEIVSA